MSRITLGDRLTALAANENLSVRDREFAASLLKSYGRKKTLSSGRRPWVDRLEARAEEGAQATENGVEVSEQFVTCRERAITVEGESSWSVGFLDSIIEQAKRGRTLSEKQRETVNKILDRFSDDAMVEAQTWAHTYRAEWQEKAKRLARFYRASNLPYWSQMVAHISASDEYVPDRERFFKMVNNKYAQKLLAQEDATPAFTVQSRVQVRKNQSTRRTLRGYIGKKGFILSIGEVREAVKGGRAYTVLFTGDARPVEIQERFLKAIR